MENNRDKDRFWKTTPDLETLIAEQGVNRFEWEAWSRKEPVWPDEEDVEEFTDWLREVRREGETGKAA